ncbi:MAG: DctP family TRAP transporter solute-binding subunit [Deltaproteobacteria bacterium]|jgi:tripartite ATP-independent transporter DctP family solute receptor|nr:DctP family TRAP transporter solute-binding subunit [Deltaproteobacteria bacterium]
MSAAKALALALLLCLAAPAAASAADPPQVGAPAKATITLRAGQVLHPGHPVAMGLEYMKRLVELRSGGEIAVEILDPATLSGERDLIESIQMGKLDLIVITTAPLYGFTPDFLVFDLPYVFPDPHVARKVLDGPFGEQTIQQARHVGLVGLAYFENGLRHVTTASKPVSRPEDLAGLRVRTLESRIHMDVFRKLGAIPVPLAFGDLYDQLRQGTLDAEENPVSVIQTADLYKVQGHMAITGHFYLPAPMFVSAGVWSKLTGRNRSLLQKAALDSVQYHRVISDYYMSPEALDFLKSRMQVTENINGALWRKAVESVRSDYRNEIGGETIDELERELLRVSGDGSSGPSGSAGPGPVDPETAAAIAAGKEAAAAIAAGKGSAAALPDGKEAAAAGR